MRVPNFMVEDEVVRHAFCAARSSQTRSIASHLALCGVGAVRIREACASGAPSSAGTVTDPKLLSCVCRARQGDDGCGRGVRLRPQRAHSPSGLLVISIVQILTINGCKALLPLAVGSLVTVRLLCHASARCRVWAGPRTTRAVFWGRRVPHAHTARPRVNPAGALSRLEEGWCQHRGRQCRAGAGYHRA